MMRALAFLLALLCSGAPAAADDRPLIRIIASDFVLPGKFARLAERASTAGFRLEGRRIGVSSGDAATWLEGAALVILDTPRPSDLARVQQHLGNALAASGLPWIRIGGGPPGFGGFPTEAARQLIAYYAAGGGANLDAFFEALRRIRAGEALAGLPPPAPLPPTGFHHPAASAAFATAEAYLRWGADRWPANAPRVAFLIGEGAVSGGETGLIDALIARSEARGMLPFALWFPAAAPDGLRAALRDARPDVLVNLTHLQNGEARRAEFGALGIPVLQGFTWRDGGPAAWEAAASGIGAGPAATLLTVPEAWGVTDPMVIAAVAEGEVVPIPAQLDALLAKARRLAVLRHAPVAERRLGLMFWNYPAGERNLSASHLNLPRSLETLTQRLAEAGYAVTPAAEVRLIEAGQAMLSGFYRPETLDALLREDLAATLPVASYRRWLDALPAARRAAMLDRWGAPEAHRAVREIAGEPRFVIPRLQLGRLAILPQPPRGGAPGRAYHGMAEPPDHLYLASYLWLREQWRADALIHFGTHGTQEWLPGKDRGLSVADFPFLALGDLPVFYPYIQDNVGEALQARRRGRATTISHQTPPFAPAGLYEELRDLHALLHEYLQLDEGAVRQAAGARLLEAVTRANLHQDLGWAEARIAEDMPGFLSALHDRLHELARQAMPLGLHRFGVAAAPEHRLATVMQQLGEPFYRALGLDPAEVFAQDFATLRDSAPYRLLHRHLRDGTPEAEIGDPTLRALVARAAELDRRLADTQEIEALLTGLRGGFVPPGAGGDPVRDPELRSGRNLFGFEPDRLPTRAAFAAGAEAFAQLVEAYRQGHGGEAPQKLAFSLWSSEAIRHLGVAESQVLHALGLRPAWDAAGRVTALEIIPASELGRPRIDIVVQVTSVYRDQFDGFMRLLAAAIQRIAALDEPGNAVARNAAAVAERLAARGLAPERARHLAALRIFGNAPGDYGSGLPGGALASTTWDSDAPLAAQFLARMQYAYGAGDWGLRLAEAEGNLFAEQLRGVQAAVLSRSSNLNGVLSTDHPFEYLGGLSLAVRHLDGAAPALFVADLRAARPRMTAAAQFLGTELRSRALNPHWITAMQSEGYAGTLAMLNLANNLFGWQVADPAMVRDDQWQAMHETYVRDSRALGLDAWFERHNPTAQAQLIERLAEAIRHGYWDATAETRRELAARYAALVERGADAGPEPTRAFLAAMAGYGFGASAAPTEPGAVAGSAEAVRGQVLQPVPPAADPPMPWLPVVGLGALLLCFAGGALRQALTEGAA
jgi:cobaltochelatase CobN